MGTNEANQSSEPLRLPDSAFSCVWKPFGVNPVMNFLIEHIGLAAQNTTALKDWYVSVLGAQLIYTDVKTPPAYFLKLPGGPLIEIYAGGYGLAGTGDNSLAGWRHLALRVASLDEAQVELARHGVNFSEAIKPAGGGGRILFFKDVEGNLLHLVERPMDSVLRSA
jgi:glyoxylase I family protein